MNIKEKILTSYASLCFKHLEKLITKYEKEHSHMGIPTCDVADIWKWIEKTKKKYEI